MSTANIIVVDDRVAKLFDELEHDVDVACDRAEIALRTFLHFACRRFVSDHSLAQAAVDAGCDNAYNVTVERLFLGCIVGDDFRLFRRHLEFCTESRIYGSGRDNNINVDAAIYLLARACLGTHTGAKQEFRLDVMTELNMALLQSVLTDSGIGVTLSFRDKSGGQMMEVSVWHYWNEDEKIIVRLVYAQK